MKAVAVAVLLILSGCASQPGLNIASERAVVVGRELNDEAINVSVFTICEGASVGAVRRKFGDEEGAMIWKLLCAAKAFFSPESMR